MSIIKTLTTALISTLFCLHSSVALSQSQIDFDFKEGAVALYCIEGDGAELPDAVFEAAFPKWLEMLQELTDVGDILRVHFLPKFRSGVFIVVGGDSLDDAKSKVGKIEESVKSILDEALKNAGITDFDHPPCQEIEIGPVALMPSK